MSIAGGTPGRVRGADRSALRPPGGSMIEVNISCPNVENRGQVFACDAIAASGRVIGAVRKAARPRRRSWPSCRRMSPTSRLIARAVRGRRGGRLSLINTLLGLVIDTDTMAPALGGVTGGLSGPAIRPVAVRCVWQVHRALPHLPILGMGGIRTGLDALQFVLAGASAVSVGHSGLRRSGRPDPGAGRAGTRAGRSRVRRAVRRGRLRPPGGRTARTRTPVAV